MSHQPGIENQEDLCLCFPSRFFPPSTLFAIYLLPMWKDNRLVLFSLNPSTMGAVRSSVWQSSPLSAFFWWLSLLFFREIALSSALCTFWWYHRLGGPVISWPKGQVTQVSHKDIPSWDSASWGYNGRMGGKGWHPYTHAKGACDGTLLDL